MTDKTKTAADMDSWQMACSLLIGLRQTIAKAKEEHAAILEANHGRTFITGASVITDTVAVLRDVERTLDYDLANIARSSGKPFPKKEGV